MKRWICILLIVLMISSVAVAEEPFVYGYDFDTTEVTEDVFAGSTLTIVNVWGTFCGPCIGEMPFLGQLAEEYADRGVRIIGIVIDVGDDQTALENARSIVEATGAGYLHLIPNEYLWNRFCVQSDYIPMSWFLDQNGELLNEEPLVGSMEYEGWKSLIDSYLGDPE